MKTTYPMAARLISFRHHPAIEITSKNTNGTYAGVWGDNSEIDDPNIPTFNGKAICRDLAPSEIRFTD